ncbi:hypothetical protein AMELA_G00237660, partial [Ameiurus melas]
VEESKCTRTNQHRQWTRPHPPPYTAETETGSSPTCVLRQTLRAIIKKFCYESTWNWTCVYIVSTHCEEDGSDGQNISKDHRWRIAEVSCILGSERLQNYNQKTPTSLRVVWKGFKKKIYSHPKTNLSVFSLPDTTGTSNGIGFYGQMKPKQSFLSINTRGGIGTQRGSHMEKYLMPMVKYGGGSLMFCG